MAVRKGNADAARQNIYGSFFKESINASNEEGMTILGDGLTGEISPNGNFGPWSDGMYINRDAWEAFDFDFNGTQDRTGDYDTFAGNPGAGTVSIDATKLVGKTVTTSDPYTFAVQGIYANEDSFTLRYEPADGYRLYGWYRFPDMLDDTAPEDHSYFTYLYKTYAVIKNVPVYGANGEQIRQETVANPVSTDNIYTPLNTENQPVQWQDNDLFAARIQALVTFHDYTGSLVDKDDGNVKSSAEEEDWYFYEAALPNVTPQAAPGGEDTTLLGWTTRKPSDFGEEYSYAAISTSELQDIKNKGEFYQAGMPVTKALDLYPVYAGLASNVITQFEGYQYNADGTPSDESTVNAGIRPEPEAPQRRSTLSAALKIRAKPTRHTTLIWSIWGILPPTSISII